MAFFNFIKNEVSGNVGQYNGIKSKGGNYIRRKRVSKAARLPVQRESFKAFAALRRQSLFQRDKLGEILTPYIKSSERPYVLANMLKKWITNHQFTPENFVNMWTPKTEYSLENVAYDQERKIFSFSIKPEPGYIVTLERKILLFVADSQGYGYFFSKQILSERKRHEVLDQIFASACASHFCRSQKLASAWNREISNNPGSISISAFCGK